MSDILRIARLTWSWNFQFVKSQSLSGGDVKYKIKLNPGTRIDIRVELKNFLNIYML